MTMFHKSILIAAVVSTGCAKEDPGVAVEEFEDVSDIPQPSRDLDGEDEDESDDDDSDSSDGGSASDDGSAGGSSSDAGIDEPAETILYDFDSESSLLYVQVFKDTSALASAFAHNHVMRADNFYGEVVYNEDEPEACEISFSLPVTELRVDEAGMRSLVGYGDTIGESDRETIRGHMLQTNQLNASAYPEITFDSYNCSGAGGKNGTLTVQGGMTVRGQTADVSIPVQFQLRDGEFYAQASFTMRHSDFGMTPYTAFAGTVRNDQPLDFTFDLVGLSN